jgi:site-specific recombinase XerD
MNKLQKTNKEDNQLLLDVESKLDFLVKGHENNSDKLHHIGNDLKKGFIGLALRNESLLKSNEQLKQQLDEVLKELNAIKQEREAKTARQKAWANRKRLPKRDPINYEIYKLLLEENEGPSYVATRTRVAICVLTVTGIRISELLPLKVGQLQTLVAEGWISIDRLKRGPANYKAFLTKEGKRIVKARKEDFEVLFLMKDKNSYIFTSDRNPNQMLQRQTLTMDVNKVTKAVSQSLLEKPNITSHSFRIGYISQLWKDTKDIEFVRQAIGHSTIDSTSSYVSHMSDQERQNRISSIDH